MINSEKPDQTGQISNDVNHQPALPALPDMTKEEDMIARRERVNELLEKGWTEKRIAKELDVSYPRIVRDVRFLKDQSFGWVDDLARTGFVFEVKKSVGELDNLKIKLYEYLDDDKVEVATKVKISREIRDILDLKLATLANGPTLQGLKRVLNQYGQGGTPSPYYNGR